MMRMTTMMFGPRAGAQRAHQQPGKPKPPGNPQKHPDHDVPPPIEDPPEPIPTPPERDEPPPMHVSARRAARWRRERSWEVERILSISVGRPDARWISRI